MEIVIQEKFDVLIYGTLAEKEKITVVSFILLK
jgi:hypothetical protein